MEIKNLPKRQKYEWIVSQLYNAVLAKRGRGVVSISAVREWLRVVGVEVPNVRERKIDPNKF